MATSPILIWQWFNWLSTIPQAGDKSVHYAVMSVSGICSITPALGWLFVSVLIGSNDILHRAVCSDGTFDAKVDIGLIFMNPMFKPK